MTMPEVEIDIQDVVEHTEGLAEDNDMSFAEAATYMGERFQDIEAKDILQAR